MFVILKGNEPARAGFVTAITAEAVEYGELGAAVELSTVSEACRISLAATAIGGAPHSYMAKAEATEPEAPAPADRRYQIELRLSEIDSAIALLSDEAGALSGELKALDVVTNP